MKSYFYFPGVHYQISLDRLFTAEDIDQFISLYQTQAVTESEIHHFFDENPKFLYLLGAYNNVMSEVTFLGKEKGNSERNQLRLDFLIQHYAKIWDVVEIKKPEAGTESLIVGSSTRPRFTTQLQDAISQVRLYLDELAESDVQRQLRERGILICRPKAWIIAGRNKDLPMNERRFLEEPLPHSVQLVTYDDLAELSKQRAVIITKPILLPLAINSNIQDLAAAVKPREPQSRSREQIVKALSSLSPADLVRLRTYAKWRVRGMSLGTHVAPEDLLQEAILATIEERRSWREGVNIVDHLFGAMRRISSRQPRTEYLRSEQDVLPELPAGTADPERIVSAEDELGRVRELFKSDSIALQVIDFLGRGLTRKEIQTTLGIPETDVTEVVKRIRRKLQKEWKS